jgi:hypothetical protein
MPQLLHFIYLPSFDTSAPGFLDEAARHRMERALMESPKAGARIRRTGGVRKLRIAPTGRGKSGGARVIYYYRASAGRLYLLFAYDKHDAANLSAAGRAIIRTLVRQLEAEP